MSDSQERSNSRGRQAFSTGRGGLGNIRPTSGSPSRPTDGPDDFSDTRGREPLSNPTKVYSTGRGGAGNIRSPSRDAGVPAPDLDVTEQEIIRNHIAAKQSGPYSSGRGGLGNMNSRSRSRGPNLTPNSTSVHSTGRGGAGNIVVGDIGNAAAIDEEERKKHAGITNPPAYHSTGRGGIANLTSAPQPPLEQVIHSPGEYESTGRGGAGNIVHNN